MLIMPNNSPLMHEEWVKGKQRDAHCIMGGLLTAPAYSLIISIGVLKLTALMTLSALSSAGERAFRHADPLSAAQRRTFYKKSFMILSASLQNFSPQSLKEQKY